MREKSGERGRWEDGGRWEIGTMEETRGRKDGKEVRESRGEEEKEHSRWKNAARRTIFEDIYLHMLAGHEWAEHEDDMMRKNTTERLAWQTETTARHEEQRK